MNRAPRGQAAVEFALVLPVVVMMLLLIIQVALVIRQHLLVHEAAREAVRAASVDPGSAAGPDAGRRIVPDAQIVVSRGEVGDPVRVVVTVRYVTAVPLVGPLVPDPALRATAEMRAER